MADFANQLMQLDSEVAQINVELESLASDRSTHESALADVNRKSIELRKKREGLSKLRESASASVRLSTHEEVAAKERAAAEQSRAEADKLKAEAATLVESLKAQHAEVSAMLEKAKAGN